MQIHFDAERLEMCQQHAAVVERAVHVLARHHAESRLFTVVCSGTPTSPAPFLCGAHIENRHPDDDGQAGHGGSDAADDLGDEPHPVFQRAAVLPGRVVAPSSSWPRYP